MSDPTFLAIIPARGGSKRLPNKNVKELNGKPLIAWTIDAALASPNVNKVVVSTDDNDIAEISLLSGAEVPYIRPHNLSTDTANTVDVIKHAIDFYAKSGHYFDFIILLQPTSPLRISADITNAIELLKEKNADAIISVCEVEHSPLWSNTIPLTGSLKSFIKDEVKNMRSQDLATYYRLNGAIYIVETTKFIEQNSLFLNDNIYAYKMNVENSVDIDNETDFSYAEFLIESRGSNNKNKSI
jgi:N-acylneuraminate cytidylyltransferase